MDSRQFKDELSAKDFFNFITEANLSISAGKQLQGRPKRALDELKQANVLPSIEGGLTTKKRQRTIGFEESKKHLSKFNEVAYREPTLDETKTFGQYPDDIQAAGLEVKLTPLNDADRRFERIMQMAAQTKEGQKSNAFDVPIDEKLTEVKRHQLLGKARRALQFETIQRTRLKKIKSKTHRRVLRRTAALEQQKIFARLQIEDPESVLVLKEEFERKRAEMRLLRQQKARQKFAKTMKRFGGKEAAKFAEKVMIDHREERDTITELAKQKVRMGEELDSDADEATTSESDEDEAESESDRLKRKVGAIVDDTNENVGGIMNMTFMKRAQEQKRKELQQEANDILRLIDEEGKETDPLDFPEQNSNSETFLERKRRKSGMKLKPTPLGADKEDTGLVDAKLVLDNVTTTQPETVIQERDPEIDEEDELEKQALELAFGGSKLESEFRQEQLEHEKETIEKEIEEKYAGTPGLNCWAGDGTEQLPENQRALKRMERIRAAKMKELEEKVKNNPTVIKNDHADHKQLKKFMLKDLPYEFGTPEQFDAFMERPMGPQWVPEEVYKRGIKEKVSVVKGAVIAPMSTEDVNKLKTEKVVATMQQMRNEYRTKQREQLKKRKSLVDIA